MKLYDRKRHRHVERQVHFGLGQSVKTACGLRLHSRTFMASIHNPFDRELITGDFTKVTCKRCLAANSTKLLRKIEIERSLSGIFDRDTLCGEQWLLEHALNISNEDIDSQTLEVRLNNNTIKLSNRIKSSDRKAILREVINGRQTEERHG